MRSSSRVVARVVAVLLALVGLLVLAGPVVSADARSDGGAVLLPVVGVFLVAMGAVSWIARGTSPDPAARTSLVQVAGQPVLQVRLRPTTPLVMLLVGASGALVVLVAMLGIGLGDGGLLLTPFLLLFLVLVPDAVRALSRRPRWELGADGLRQVGWTTESYLAWDDVSAVTLTTADPRRPRLVVAGRLGAPSWQVTSHRILVPLDRVPQRPEIAVLVSALDLPSRVQVLVERFAREPRHARVGYLDGDGVAFLSGAR